MSTLIWHPDALDDIARLHDFLAPVSPAAARQSALVIQKAANEIFENPAIGIPHAEFREWRARFGRSSYVLRYILIPSDIILITRVWHSRELRKIPGK